MKLRILSFVVCCAFACGSLLGQSLNKANKYFRELNYQRAIEMYESILKKGVQPQALFNLSECYRKIGNSQKAEYWYSQAVLHPEATPEMFVYLGQAQLANNNAFAARRNFEKFLTFSPNDARAKNLVQACEDSTRQELLNGGLLYQVKPVEEVNSENDDFSPAFHKRGFVYCTERDTGGMVLRRSAWTGRPFVKRYYTIVRLIDEDKMEFRFSKPEEFSRELNTKYHDGSVDFSRDGSMILATRNHVNRGKILYSSAGIVHTKIISAQKSGDTWDKIDNVSFNNPEYSVMHPALTPDGSKMYFSSDMPGGFGNMDLYVAYREGNGSWSAPVNLGPGINTEGDEAFPYVSNDGLLYFASDGHTGLGGLDIYYSRAVRGRWDPVTNLGAPLNSGKDDFGFALDTTRKYGFISSNRDGGKGLADIYLFTRLSVDAEILVFRDDNGHGLDSVAVTCDCYPKKTFYTNIEGKLYLEMPVNRTCNFKLNAPNFEPKEIAISTKDFAVGSQLVQQVPIETDKNLSFAVEGLVKDKNDGKTITGAALTLLSSCTNTTQVATADAEGKFNFKLEPSCCYVVRASKTGYFTATTNFCTKGLYLSDTLEAQIDMPALLTIGGKSILDTNSVFVVDNIYHEYDRADIKIESSLGLKTLLTLLQNNPDLAIEIRSHTDSRGSANYNQSLSERRAKAIATYLINNNIAETRLAYKGVGEAELLNNCADGVSCSEEQHLQNRRTEFRAVKLQGQ
jgi:outer membrane protein OmpA-like peptidoglycan-associated protein/tetratricopeptide (TPR) repeat protein